MSEVTLQEKPAGKGTSYYIIIPKSIIKALDWKKGMKLKIKIINYEGKQAILITPP